MVYFVLSGVIFGGFHIPIKLYVPSLLSAKKKIQPKIQNTGQSKMQKNLLSCPNTRAKLFQMLPACNIEAHLGYLLISAK